MESFIQPHQIKHEPDMTDINDTEKYHRQWPNVESQLSSNNSSLSHSSTGMTGLLKEEDMPQSEGNPILKFTPTYHSRPSLRKVVKCEPELPPFSPQKCPLGDVKQESSVDVNTDQHPQPLIDKIPETSPFSFMENHHKTSTSPDECKQEEIDHVDKSFSLYSADHSADNVSIDNSSKNRNSVAIFFQTVQVKDNDKARNVVKPRLTYSRQFPLGDNETQPTKSTPNQKTFKDSTHILTISKNKVAKRKACSKTKHVAKTYQRPSSRCDQSGFLLKKRVCNEGNILNTSEQVNYSDDNLVKIRTNYSISEQFVNPSVKFLQPRVVLERIDKLIQLARNAEKTQPAKNASNNKIFLENTTQQASCSGNGVRITTNAKKEGCEAKELVKHSSKVPRLSLLDETQQSPTSTKIKSQENSSDPAISSLYTEMSETPSAQYSPYTPALEENAPNKLNSAQEEISNQQAQNCLEENVLVENSDSKSSSWKSKYLTLRNVSIYNSDDDNKSTSNTSNSESNNTASENNDIQETNSTEKSEEIQGKELKSKGRIFQASKRAKRSAKISPHQCLICDDIFKNVNQLRYHVVKHVEHVGTSKTEEESEMHYKCSICQSVLPSVKSLNDHLQVHDSEVFKLTKSQSAEKLECKICFLTFYGNVTLNAHKKVHEFSKLKLPDIENFRKKNVCYFCGKKSTDIYQLKIHLRVHTGEKPHKCTECGRAFAYKGALTQHASIHKGTKDHICDVCGKAFRLAAKLARHKKTHSKNIFNMLPCLYCEKKFLNRWEIMEHEKNVHFKVYEKDNGRIQCPDCHKSISKKCFKTHCQTHLKRERKFHCDKCSKSFWTMNVLKKHAKHHADEIKYICEYCGKGYSDTFSFTKHTWSHSKTNSFSCECGREFMTKDLLEAHKLKFPFEHVRIIRSPHIETIEKVHTKSNYSKEELLKMNKRECPICYKLLSPSYFYEHKKIHKERKREFQCPVCLMQFITKKILRKHCKTHISVKPFECTYEKCQRIFLDENLFDQHMEGHRELVRKFKDLQEQHVRDDVAGEADEAGEADVCMNGDEEKNI